MQLASPLPWWLALLAAAGIAAAAYVAYQRASTGLSTPQRATLTALRALSLTAIVIVLCRPVTFAPAAASDSIVPVLVDVSRSMRVADVDGSTRTARASQLVEQIWPALAERFTPELLGVGDGVTPLTVEELHADDGRSDLQGALESVRERYRGRNVPGIVLLSDGVDTTIVAGAEGDAVSSGIPLYAVPVGAPTLYDREIVSVLAGDPRMGEASVDLQVSSVSHGYGREPFDVRVSANGVQVESRTVTPAVDGSPATELFTVSPDPVGGTVYSASIAPAPGELVVENNTVSVLVSPAGRPRRILALYGAPGYDHSFLSRALSRDSGLEVDVVVLKGRDETGADTFLIQAAPSRARALATGFPESRAALYAYDAILLANVEADSLTRQRLELVADFVGVRGGGLIVAGSRSFAAGGFIGTAIEDVLPLALDNRRGIVTRDMFDAEAAPAQHAVGLTSEGAAHPVMRLGASLAESSRRWANVPTLAGVAALGGPRPGASVLAISTTPDGGVAPLVAVQRYGAGRSLVFGGEASWRWRMLLPAADRTYESFWRQAVRWVSAPAPDTVTIGLPESPQPGEALRIVLDARNAEFSGVSGATVDATVTTPSGAVEALSFQQDTSVAGRFTALLTPAEAGLFRVRAEARQGASQLGVADQWFLVGAHDRELSDPRVNEPYLRRLARASGGALIRPEDIGTLQGLLEASTEAQAPVLDDLWHRPWVFGLIVALLAGEWTLRRRWGLR
ncbi:MAG: glutamine amidotransferase [Vicinamibacterales bacterium]